jgi:hypothetical protein
MNTDSSDQAESSEIESDTQRRRRLARNRRQRELYGARHRRRRRHFARLVKRGEAICSRCLKPIEPGALWDLGHDDRNPELELPEHAACNRAAAKTSRVW